MEFSIRFWFYQISCRWRRSWSRGSKSRSRNRSRSWSVWWDGFHTSTEPSKVVGSIRFKGNRHYSAFWCNNRSIRSGKAKTFGILRLDIDIHTFTTRGSNPFVLSNVCIIVWTLGVHRNISSFILWCAAWLALALWPFLPTNQTGIRQVWQICRRPNSGNLTESGILAALIHVFDYVDNLRNFYVTLTT